MKYTNEIIINADRAKVVELFDNPNNMDKWQPGFISMELVSGESGKPGAKSKLKYKMGKREIEMIETITERNLPETFSGTYEAKNVWNDVQNHFEELPDGKTKLWAESEFKLSGFMKVMGWLMPGAFKKQSQKYLEYFKEFVEKETV